MYYRDLVAEIEEQGALNGVKTIHGFKVRSFLLRALSFNLQSGNAMMAIDGITKARQRLWCATVLEVALWRTRLASRFCGSQDGTLFEDLVVPDSGMGATASVSAGTESEESSANMSSMALISASLGFKGISK